MIGRTVFDHVRADGSFWKVYPLPNPDFGVYIGQVATVRVDGEAITGTVYYVRDNGWPCVETNTGRLASGPQVQE